MTKRELMKLLAGISDDAEVGTVLDMPGMNQASLRGLEIDWDKSIDLLRRNGLLRNSNRAN